MTDITAAVATMVLLVIGIFIGCVLGSIIGALSGWAVSFIFDETLTKVLAALGIKGLKLWEFGAFLGFVGGFLKTTVKQQKD